ncbi:hypothetical protein [Pseudomarimonas salicorniae]|uniref:Uncharacterized protein n=1 Tax=Pseudomarimonas salicorniae TaxID=2933270 RepID=A0ABT0GLD1_9GAMM|nr:hypothetical protein [Lysobacter sp. CAU 1642]MCK7595339.1 hypothetical protein [Lysobacter sp. CAU 1642]
MKPGIGIFALAFALLPSTALAEMIRASDGRGDALYLPYYTVEGGAASLLTVRNHADHPALAQVRFVESLNGQSVLSLNLALPAQGTWTAAVIESAEGGAELVSASSVCTVPILAGSAPGFARFRVFDYDVRYPDGGPGDVGRTRAGAVEVLGFAAPLGPFADEVDELECRSIQERYLGERASVISALQPLHGPPSAALSASMQIVEVSAGTVLSYEGTAIRGFFNRVSVVLPDDPLPRFSTPLAETPGGELLLATPSARYAVSEARGPDAVSALFMATGLEGDVANDPSIGAATDWLIAFPTRHAYVAALPGSLFDGGGPVAPFSEAFTPEGACQKLKLSRRRADGQPLFDPQSDPPPPPQRTEAAVCPQVGLLPFVAIDGLDETAARVRFAGDALPGLPLRRADDGQQVILPGLPVIGLRLSRFVNGNLGGGVLANYSFAEPLKPLVQAP